MAISFNIINYLSGLTGFVFDKAVLERVAQDRGVDNVQSYSELEQQDKDLLLADLLFIIYTSSPDSSASYSTSHGSFKISVGSQTINEMRGIYNTMISLYKKWGDDRLAIVTQPHNLNIEIIDATGSWL